MLIKNLPPFLRKRAIRNHYDPKCSEHARLPFATSSTDGLLNEDISIKFSFRESPEGYKFWLIVYSGQFYHPYVLFKYLITW